MLYYHYLFKFLIVVAQTKKKEKKTLRILSMYPSNVYII